MRSQWYQDDSGPSFSLARLKSLSATRIIVLGLIAIWLLQQITFLNVTEVLALDVSKLSNPLQWYRLFTYSLIHSEGNPQHLLFNGIALWFLGDLVEIRFGRRRYLRFCVVAAIVSALAYLAWLFLQGWRESVLLGASGVVMAVSVAFATLAPNANIWFFKAWAFVAILVAIDILMTLRAEPDGVAHAAHIGGAAFGFFAVKSAGSIERLADRLRGVRDRRRDQSEAERRRELDRLLDKIKESGLSSLTRAERKFLESASKEYRSRR